MSGGAMPNPEKIERVATLKERIEGSDALLLTEYRGLSVSEITELRRSLAAGGTRFAVVKNTLMRRAAEQAGVDDLVSLLEGPSAVAFVSGDPVAAAKSVVDAAKKFPTLVLKGGFMDGRMLSADEAKALASLESREAMLSKIAGLMKAEMSRAAAMFAGAQSKFLGVLETYKAKLPGETSGEAAPAADPMADEDAASADADTKSGSADEPAQPEASDDDTALEDTPDDTPEADASAEEEGEA
jgi:large subunit ribosomal protein L10